MSFGNSVSDFIFLAQLARQTYRNCQKAGDEYVQVAQQTRSLHSVLKILRTEAEHPDSVVFKQDAGSASELLSLIKGCRAVLTGLDGILGKYEGLKQGSTMGAGKKMLQKFRFGSKIEELGVVRGKLITYTSTLPVILDTMQLKATGGLRITIEDGFAEMRGDFADMRREILATATRERVQHRHGSLLSLSSLSTFDGDNKETWRSFRKDLIGKGFHSQTLDKHRDVLVAYMMKIDQSGLLDKAAQASEHPHLMQNPWWTKNAFMESIQSLSDLHISTEGSLSSESGAATLHVDSVVTPPATTGTVSKPSEESPWWSIRAYVDTVNSLSDLKGKETVNSQAQSSWASSLPYSSKAISYFESSATTARKLSAPRRRTPSIGVVHSTSQLSKDEQLSEPEGGKSPLQATISKAAVPLPPPPPLMLWESTEALHIVGTPKAALLPKGPIPPADPVPSGWPPNVPIPPPPPTSPPSTSLPALQTLSVTTLPYLQASLLSPSQAALQTPFHSNPSGPQPSLLPPLPSTLEPITSESPFVNPDETWVKRDDSTERNRPTGAPLNSPHEIKSDGQSSITYPKIPPMSSSSRLSLLEDQPLIMTALSKSYDSPNSRQTFDSTPTADMYDEDPDSDLDFISSTSSEDPESLSGRPASSYYQADQLSQEMVEEITIRVKADLVNYLHRREQNAHSPDVKFAFPENLASFSTNKPMNWPRRGILKYPTSIFPEDPDPQTEFVAVLHAAARGILKEATWTKISRRVVSPEALKCGTVRFGYSDDHVIVFQALGPRCIAAYANITRHILERNLREE